jgi:hypothetical protein
MSIPKEGMTRGGPSSDHLFLPLPELANRALSYYIASFKFTKTRQLLFDQSESSCKPRYVVLEHPAGMPGVVSFSIGGMNPLSLMAANVT